MVRIAAAAAGASAVGIAFMQSSTANVPERRNTQATSGLCGSASSSSALSTSSCAANKFSALAAVSWDPCCAFEFDVEETMCREFTVSTPYCTDLSGECADAVSGAATCDNLGEDDQIVLSLEFDLSREEETCCQTCVCFGDPECIAFDGTEDLWIPCDARRSSGDCKVYKSECDNLMGPNGDMCEWTASGSSSSNVNIALEGSPCVPNLSSPISMNMYTSENGNIKVDLNLGERGVITEITVTTGNNVRSLTSDDCFSEGADAWSGSSLPDSWVFTEGSSTGENFWSIRHGGSNTILKLLCMRAVDGNKVGPPRINVQELSVSNDDNGSGYCHTGSISEKVNNGDTAHSTAIHQKCVQNQTEAIQACKHLVNQALPYNMLEECAATYCTLAAQDTDDCIKFLKPNNEDKWLTAYCTNIMMVGTADSIPNKMSTCRQMVREEGYNWAIRTWGKGHASEAIADGSCGTTIEEYDIKNYQDTCLAGMYIEVLEDGEWEQKYFIPIAKPLCDNQLLITGADAPELFSNQMRLRQCNAQASSERCSAVSACASVPGAEFSVTFTNTGATIANLIEENLLRCVEREDDDGSILPDDWCFPDSSNYTPLDKICPCPDERRVLKELMN